jgi:hypothetical protein
MGKVVALLVFLGGALIIRAMLTAEVSKSFLATGVCLVAVAIVLFIAQIRRI